ncbi:hypothetical protein PFISCL1PPCAC_18899, partial [Pristionchus fissidentatus]
LTDENEERYKHLADFYGISTLKAACMGNLRKIHRKGICAGNNDIFPEPKTFEEESNLSDVVLIVENRKLYVSRHIVGRHSKFFYDIMISNDSRYKGEKEYSLPGIRYDDMEFILHIIYNDSIDYEHELYDKDVKFFTEKTSERHGYLEMIDILLTINVILCCERLQDFCAGLLFKFGITKEVMLIADKYRLCNLLTKAINGIMNREQLNELYHEEFTDALKDTFHNLSLKFGSDTKPTPIQTTNNYCNTHPYSTSNHFNGILLLSEYNIPFLHIETTANAEAASEAASFPAAAAADPTDAFFAAVIDESAANPEAAARLRDAVGAAVAAYKAEIEGLVSGAKRTSSEKIDEGTPKKAKI